MLSDLFGGRSHDHHMSINDATTVPRTKKQRRRLAAAAATAFVAGGALALPVASVAGPATEAGPASPTRAAHPNQAEADLGDVTLDELAAELRELGFEVNLTPALTSTGASEPTDTDTEGVDDGEFGDSPAALGSFAIDGDEIDLSSAPSPEIADQASEIWERFVRLIPADQRQMVSSFELDGEEGGGAYVYPNENDPTKWTLGVSVGLGEDLDYVLIHEFGHLLTLQASEVPPGEGDPTGCKTFHTGEGCALAGSTVAEFVQKFWPEEQLDRLGELYENEDYDAIDEFYQEHRDDFVTDYAASNPGEDLAETFAVFVTEDRPTGDSIADQKVELLWNDEAMVQLRDQIRANL